MDQDLHKQKIAFFNEELTKINQILSSLNDGTGVLLTMASLLSFLPQLVIENDFYLQHFLSWTFWLLIIAIICYYPASLRLSSIIKGRSFSPVGSDDWTKILKDISEASEIVWKKSVENHDSVMFWNKLTKSFIYAYSFSLISNFYVFVFFGAPSICVSLILLTISLLIGMFLFFFLKLKSEKGKIIGQG